MIFFQLKKNFIVYLVYAHSMKMAITRGNQSHVGVLLSC